MVQMKRKFIDIVTIAFLLTVMCLVHGFVVSPGFVYRHKNVMTAIVSKKIIDDVYIDRVA